jgi:hypothetical protein
VAKCTTRLCMSSQAVYIVAYGACCIAQLKNHRRKVDSSRNVAASTGTVTNGREAHHLGDAAVEHGENGKALLLDSDTHQGWMAVGMENSQRTHVTCTYLQEPMSMLNDSACVGHVSTACYLAQHVHWPIIQTTRGALQVESS